MLIGVDEDREEKVVVLPASNGSRFEINPRLDVEERASLNACYSYITSLIVVGRWGFELMLWFIGRLCIGLLYYLYNCVPT